MSESSASLKGRLLIASPQLRDPNFYRAVVLLIQHDADGTLGLVLNRPMDTSVPAAWKKLSGTPCKLNGVLYSGGPCQGVLMAVHDDLEASDVAVMDGVHFSSSREAIEHIVAHTRKARLFVGYAGWSVGQLEAEIEQGAWQLLPATPEAVFDPSASNWQSLRWEITRSALARWMPPHLIPRDPSLN